MPVNVTPILRTALRQLKTERDRVDRQLDALRTALNSDSAPPKASRRRRPMTAAARRALSRRMKVYWAKRKAAKHEKSKAVKKAS
jgi:hypothetical protein